MDKSSGGLYGFTRENDEMAVVFHILVSRPTGKGGKRRKLCQPAEPLIDRQAGE